MNFTAHATQQLLREAVLHRAGMALSGLCLVHCLLMPLVLTVAPAVFLASLPAGWIEAEWLHAALIVPVVLVSGPALWRSGGRWAGVLVAALAALIAALFVASETLETGLTVAGALSLLAAHGFALRQRSAHGLS
ncbi:MAG: MerC domain-containing protein [Erythrobacter sp.]|jgi:hypothetical protein